MDGTHDLGGKQGFGPIQVQHEYLAFEHYWEGRMWALAQTTRNPHLTIDWFRHLVECLEPQAYLTMPYFEKWAMAHLAGLTMSEVFTTAQIIEGTCNKTNERPPDATLEDVLVSARNKSRTFQLKSTIAPAFKTGDIVHTLSHGKRGHTRLPGYMRARQGKILSHHGAHSFADEGAKGLEMAQHLYTVVFSARELWGNEASKIDTVSAELWESYLVSA
ncbi:MAG: nitrile hydratase subunit beta [Rhizobiaceae bacterium]|nr:nitrile hydratase subunit beta [Rhizobiaceae bacterium]